MKKNSKKSPVSVICSVLGTAILVAVIFTCLILTIPKFFGGQFFAVVSGSMEPEISTGSLVYVQKTEPGLIESDEIIAFYAARDTSTIVTHRVVENQTEEKEFITKGDANRTEDMNPTRYSNLIGKVVFHVPGVGFAAQAMTSFYGKVAMAGMLGIAIILHLMADSVDKNKKKKES